MIQGAPTMIQGAHAGAPLHPPDRAEPVGIDGARHSLAPTGGYTQTAECDYNLYISTLFK
ncbi:MAG: hypothetical protein LBB73_04820 [Dysgonamonadaceae bacterium]|jgi:hypothetical protein|nr:hypothetical protein [Dysgonamonadaceae bacterium]